MTFSKVLEHAKEQYAWEAQRRDKLNSSASIPIGFATLGGAVIAPAASKIRLPFDSIDTILLILIGIAIVFGIMFVYHTVRFFLGPIYEYVADCNSVVEFWQSSREYYEKYPDAGEIDLKFDEFLLTTFSKCATVNCKNNDVKSARLYLMNRWVLTFLFPCLIASFLLAVPPMFSFEGGVQMAEKQPQERPPAPAPPPERGVKDGAKAPIPKTQ
jgi:disulfide bond formation protein DsbB